jgi:hypothetical protein
MKNLSIYVALLVFASSAVAQTRSNAAIQQQLRSLGSEKISVYFDEGSKVTTIRAVSENFPDGDAKRAGLKAMNFAAGVIYPSAGLDRSPEQYMLSFWVMSGKPRFGEDHTFNVLLGNETLQLGNARYAFRARDGMEYLNFNLTREQLNRIASESKVRFLLGRHDFTFTPSQLKILADLCLATEVK